MAWYAKWFDTPYYHLLYSNRDFKEAERFLDLLTEFLQLPEKSSIIDLACGKGRHSLYLNRLGYDVIGLDLSENSILHNKKYENDSLKFEVHDMRMPMAYQNINAIFNLFTSFGYFDDAQDDHKVFRSVSEVLQPNGIFVLDFLNADFVRSNLIASEIIRRERMDFHIERRIENAFIIKDIFFRDQGEDFHFFEKVKLHTMQEIEQLAQQYGLHLRAKFGDYQLNEFHPETSPRTIMVFIKNEMKG